mmetsp:Transcript_27032/g.76351  ORF Transcript_27032/g.76351 Transcript_27032/m.76351 type:complete len:441 (+) Transcript_27032:1-1323(+)
MAGAAEDDDLPPLVGEEGQELPPDDLPPLVPAEAVEAEAARGEAPGEKAEKAEKADSAKAGGPAAGGADRVSEAATLKAAMALQAQAALEAASTDKAAPVSAEDAIKGLIAETDVPKKEFKEPDENTKRMVMAISKDDFEECEDAIMQGADVNADCGAGLRAIHISALRGEMFLTELLLAQGANVNERDLSGNTPLLYACHFYRQHGRGVQVVAQLLYHKADPFYRVKDGKLAGKSAHDLMDKACREPNTDENVPIQMRAMIQLAMDGGDGGREAITKMWMQFKSQNKKLYQVSSKKDNYDYVMKNIDWELPGNENKGLAYAPKRLEGEANSISEEKFTYLRDYSFTDEGEKVKVYVALPDGAAAGLAAENAITVDFEIQALDLKLRTANEHYRLRIEPLFGTVEVEQCKHRVSSGSKKVTLTLVKRHKNRTWSAIQKAR